jgi:hypothetical protein
MNTKKIAHGHLTSTLSVTETTYAVEVEFGQNDPLTCTHAKVMVLDPSGEVLEEAELCSSRARARHLPKSMVVQTTHSLNELEVRVVEPDIFLVNGEGICSGCLELGIERNLWKKSCKYLIEMLIARNPGRGPEVARQFVDEWIESGDHEVVDPKSILEMCTIVEVALTFDPTVCRALGKALLDLHTDPTAN